MSHVHTLDGKQVNYPNGNCPICNPEKFQPAQPAQARQYPKVYRKGNTVVVMLSKTLMATTTWWEKGNAFLHTLSKMSRDGQGNVIQGADGNPQWDKRTIRMSRPILTGFVTELSKLLSDTENKPNVPQRE